MPATTVTLTPEPAHAPTGEVLMPQNRVYDIDQVFGMEGLPDEEIGLDLVALDYLCSHIAAE